MGAATFTYKFRTKDGTIFTEEFENYRLALDFAKEYGYDFLGQC